MSINLRKLLVFERHNIISILDFYRIFEILNQITVGWGAVKSKLGLNKSMMLLKWKKKFEIFKEKSQPEHTQTNRR